MKLIGNKVNLRDFNLSDYDTRIYWETQMNEYLLWDAPWETEYLSEAKKVEELIRYKIRLIEWIKDDERLNNEDVRKRFQIETKEGEYIGW